PVLAIVHHLEAAAARRTGEFPGAADDGPGAGQGALRGHTGHDPTAGAQVAISVGEGTIAGAGRRRNLDFNGSEAGSGHSIERMVRGAHVHRVVFGLAVHDHVVLGNREDVALGRPLARARAVERPARVRGRRCDRQQ
ncbi:unnamed protein product, partial [Durusdinium trenchii]